MLKSKQTRVVYRDNQHMRMAHRYACFLSITLVILMNRNSSITQSDEPKKGCITVEPPNKGYVGNRPVVLCSEVVPILEVHQKVIILSPKIFRYYRQLYKTRVFDY